MEICSVICLDWPELLAEELIKKAEGAGVAARAAGCPPRVEFLREQAAEMISVITQHILEDLRPFEIRRLVGLLPLEQSEREKVIPLALELSGRRDHSGYVRGILEEHFSANRTLVTEGIVRFRMPELIEEWAACADRAAEELLLSDSYSELFRILGLVSEIGFAELKSIEICLILHGDGSFVLTDENGCRIESSKCEINSLMALLSGLGPSFLSVYDLTRGSSEAVLSAIRSLFGNRVRFFTIRN